MPAAATIAISGSMGWTRALIVKGQLVAVSCLLAALIVCAYRPTRIVAGRRCAKPGVRGSSPPPGAPCLTRENTGCRQAVAMVVLGEVCPLIWTGKGRLAGRPRPA